MATYKTWDKGSLLELNTVAVFCGIIGRIPIHKLGIVMVHGFARERTWVLLIVVAKGGEFRYHRLGVHDGKGSSGVDFHGLYESSKGSEGLELWVASVGSLEWGGGRGDRCGHRGGKRRDCEG